MTVMFGPTTHDLMPISKAPGSLEGELARQAAGDWERRWYRPARFEYQMVHSYEEAVAALVEHGPEAKIIAGGQSLVPMMNLRLLRPTALIDLNGIGSSQPHLDGGRLVLPAMSRYSAVLASPMVRSESPLLAAAVAHVGNVRVRNRGTLGGSLAHGQPTAELGAVILALEGDVVAYGPQGSRVIRAEDFFLGLLKTSLRPDEVVTALRLPLSRPRRGWSFQEISRRSGNPAIVGVAASLELAPGDDVVASLGIGLIGVADRPVAGHKGVTSSLVGKSPSAEQLEGVAAAVAAATCPESDVHASGEYRRRLVKVLTRRALTEALLGARGGS
jgi:CO/xanthine dehydrogenase FAD-binding subunit